MDDGEDSDDDDREKERNKNTHTLSQGCGAAQGCFMGINSFNPYPEANVVITPLYRQDN